MQSGGQRTDRFLDAVVGRGQFELGVEGFQMKPEFLSERLKDIRLGWSGVAHRTIDDTGRRFPLTMGLEGVMCGS